MPYSYFELIQGFFIVHSTIGSTVHSMPLNSLEHCIWTITMTNIRPDRDSNLVGILPGFKPQPIQMSHRQVNITGDAMIKQTHQTQTAKDNVWHHYNNTWRIREKGETDKNNFDVIVITHDASEKRVKQINTTCDVIIITPDVSGETV